MDKSLDAQLAIVGPDDGQLQEVKDLIHYFELEDKVVLPGLLSGDDVTAAFQDADLFVLPCRTDTFPMAMIESCQAGTPMVITNCCEIAHLVADRVADVVPFDAEQFAVAMASLLTDEARYQRYQVNTVQVMADTFSVQVVVDKLEALYRRVIEENANKQKHHKPSI
ncbi:MAG: glycosyltransferase family 4 protein [Chloroflexi bacterium]|nr:glycosyltransferase family 4 protein [Chloroflexota bacterium]